MAAMPTAILAFQSWKKYQQDPAVRKSDARLQPRAKEEVGRKLVFVSGASAMIGYVLGEMNREHHTVRPTGVPLGGCQKILFDNKLAGVLADILEQSLGGLVDG